jgi:hypothetical protein
MFTPLSQVTHFAFNATDIDAPVGTYNGQPHRVTDVEVSRYQGEETDVRARGLRLNKDNTVDRRATVPVLLSISEELEQEFIESAVKARGWGVAETAEHAADGFASAHQDNIARAIWEYRRWCQASDYPVDFASARHAIVAARTRLGIEFPNPFITIVGATDG